MSAPNKFGSNLSKSTICLMIDPDGVPYGPDNPFPIELEIDSTGLATSANQTTQITALGTINTSVGTTNTSIGATNEAAAATDAATSGLNGLFKRLLARITTIWGVAQGASTASLVGPIIQASVTTAAPTYTTAQVNPLSLTTTGNLRTADAAVLAKLPTFQAAGAPSATEVASIQGAGYTGTCTVTRAANQTPYSIGDVVGGVLTIANVCPSAGDILITSIRMMLNITALPSGMSTFTLHIYNATPPSAIADNSPFTLGSGDRAAYLAHIDNIPVTALGVGTQSVQAQLDNIIQQFKPGSGTSLFAYLVTNTAWTPAANSETYDMKVKGILP